MYLTIYECQMVILGEKKRKFRNNMFITKVMSIDWLVLVSGITTKYPQYRNRSQIYTAISFTCMLHDTFIYALRNNKIYYNIILWIITKILSMQTFSTGNFK